MAKGQRTFTAAELGEVASGLRRVLEAVALGDLKADSGTVARLEGAIAALEALAEGRSVI
jgi:hypothetical protein